MKKKHKKRIWTEELDPKGDDSTSPRHMLSVVSETTIHKNFTSLLPILLAL